MRVTIRGHGRGQAVRPATNGTLEEEAHASAQYRDLSATARVSSLGWPGALAAYGLTELVFGSNDFPTAGSDGAVTGERWLGIEAHGWTNGCVAAVGPILILGSPRHSSGKAVAELGSLILGAAAVIAIIDGEDVLGVLAANSGTHRRLGRIRGSAAHRFWAPRTVLPGGCGRDGALRARRPRRARLPAAAVTA